MAIHPPYAERVRAAHSQILKITEYAVSLSMSGDPQASVKHLLFHGNATLNAKLVETAYLVLHRYFDKIADAPSLSEAVHDLRTRFATNSNRPPLGEQKRQAGGLTLRTGGTPAKAAAAVTPG